MKQVMHNLEGEIAGQGKRELNTRGSPDRLISK
jgi:hypothetical protein